MMAFDESIGQVLCRAHNPPDLILLDGDALIGYVGTEPTRDPHPPQR